MKMAAHKVVLKRKLPVKKSTLDDSTTLTTSEDDSNLNFLQDINDDGDSSDSDGEHSQESDGELDSIEGEETVNEDSYQDDSDDTNEEEDSAEDVESGVEDDESASEEDEDVHDESQGSTLEIGSKRGKKSQNSKISKGNLKKDKAISLNSFSIPNGSNSNSRSRTTTAEFARDLWEDGGTKQIKQPPKSQSSDFDKESDEEDKKTSSKSSWNIKPISDKIKTTVKSNIDKSTNNDTNKPETSAISKENVTTNEYEDGDTSDEEDIRNTVGNIPMNWYDDYPHFGYDWEGSPIFKPKSQDALDIFLKRMEDPNFLRTVKDPQTGQDVVLSERDVELIRRIQSHKIPDASFDDTAPWIEYFSSQVMKTPLRNFPEHKRSFIPSKSEAAKVSKYVHALKMGWIKTLKEVAEEHRKKREKNFYMLWGSDDNAVQEMRRVHNHLPAPKRLLPGHAESYNPPSEYLFSERELKQWESLEDNPWKRKLHFVPQKFNSLREVPAYSRFIRERFLRCLDLYMCPRARKMKLMIEPEDLLPKLPSPRDLQPFPTTLSMVYEGHTDMVRSVTIDPKGQFLVSGSDDYSIKVWEVSTGRCLRTILVGGIVRHVSWCPNPALSLVAVAADRKLLLVNPGVGDNLIVAKTDSLLKELPEETSTIPERVKAAVQWEEVGSDEWSRGIRAIVNHFKEIRQVVWHGRGDYFASVMPEGANRSVIIHQLSKRRSQVPFSKSKGLVQCALFHPIRPILFVATQRNIRAYDLIKQELVKKLLTLSQWISSMAFHPGGDNLIVGTYDRKVHWFDLDLSTKPYRTMRLHGKAVRSVAVHKRYPLFASGSDDRTVIVCHGMVYNDLLKNALIVPLKRLEHHKENDLFGVFDVLFHPTQPWIFSAGADHTIRLCT